MLLSEACNFFLWFKKCLLIWKKGIQIEKKNVFRYIFYDHGYVINCEEQKAASTAAKSINIFAVSFSKIFVVFLHRR